jgi:hypothetical protein
MGKLQDIVPGGVVQLAGTMDANHVLHLSQIVILTGYVQVAEDARRTQ